MSANSPTAPGKHDVQVGTQLVGDRDSVSNKVLAGSDGAAQRGRGGGVGQQRAQPGRSVRSMSART